MQQRETHAPVIGALVVTWNRKADVLDCISSLVRLSYPSLKFYVVDNASSDGTADAIGERYPQVNLIRSEENLGFAGGNNLGLARMLRDGVDAAFLINDDAVVAEDVLEKLVACGFADPSIGVLAPKILVHSDPQIIWAAGAMVDPVAGVTFQRHYGERDLGQADEVAEIDYAVGCAMLVKAAVMRKVGLMDTRYFMYYEEVDWCRRIRRAGYRIVYVPEGRVWHKVAIGGSGSSGAPYYFSRNRLLYLSTGRTHPGRIAWVALSDILRSAAAHAVKGRSRESLLMIKAVADYYSNTFGKLGVDS